MVAQARSDYGIHSRSVALAASSTEVEVTPGTPLEASTEPRMQLKRELGLFSAVNFIIGIMIGALAFAELGTVVPRSGGEYAYFQEAYGNLHRFWGPLPSFICAWVYVVVLRPAEVAVIILTFSEYICQPFLPLIGDIDPHSFDIAKKLIAILGVGLLTFINFISVKLYVKVQNTFTSFKLIVCLIVIICGIYELCIAFYSGLWAFDGWSCVTSVTEEVKKPEVNIPLSIMIAVPLVTAVYFMINVAYMTVLSIPEMVAAPAVAVGFLTFLFIAAGDITSLIDFVSFLVWIFYGAAMVALIIMRRTKKDAVRPYKVAIWIPVFIIFIALFLCLIPIITDPSPRYFIALLFIGIGVAIYIPLVYYKRRPAFMDKFTYFIQVLMEVVPSEQDEE
ncbi:hypothetical protein C0J52_24260 [Blattella germanica]|nr:hypothetical protein C0J52_24260 [Blattella germanica]